jgi:hypothetical protein
MSAPAGIASVVALTFAATPVHDLARSPTKSSPLQAHVRYSPSLFTPHVVITPPEAGWGGRQYVDHGYDWFVVDGAAGGVAALSAPSSHQSVAATVRILETARATSAKVGFTVTSRGATTVAGLHAVTFSGVASGTYGHSFVPFSGHSTGSGEQRGDRNHYDHGKAFRIVVVGVHGKPVVLFVDSDAPTIDASFAAAAQRLLAALRFT